MIKDYILKRFTKLNNGKYIFKGHDPNHTEWFTYKEAIEYSENIDKVDAELEAKMFDWNEMTMDQYAEHLENKFIFQSTGTAKAVMEMVDFYRANKDNSSKILHKK